MAATASTMQHSFGLGPRSSNPSCGAQQASGVHQPAAGAPGGPHPQEQHHKPFFYIQPSQPYMPVQGLQWPVPVPMPMAYNPYYAYPGLGYGMPMMPNYPPNPYMEPPGFVVPHTHLHLMDYRRVLNPQYYQTMAYHSRRFRYQHNSSNREMISSEVQTEPLSTAQRTSTPGPSDLEASIGLPDCSNGSPSVPNSQHVSPALTVQKGEQSLEFKEVLPTSSTTTTTKMSPNGSFVIQTEEVRIECCTTPVGLQLLHSHETAKVSSHSFSQDVVQCSSILQGHILPDQGQSCPADPSDQAPQPCPDILLVGVPSEKIPDLEESSMTQMEPVAVAANIGSPRIAEPDISETRGEEEEQTATFNNSHCGDANMPFDPEYLDELRKMETSVWSMEDTLIPSPGVLTPNDHMESYDEMMVAVAEEPPADGLMLAEEAPAEEVVMMEGEQERQEPTEDGPREETSPKADVSSQTLVPVVEETLPTEATPTEADHAPYVMQGSPPLKANGSQHGPETKAEEHQDTSFESLPAYLPSTSWLADFDNIYYCNKLQLTPKTQNRPLNCHGLDVPSRRRKLDLDYKEPSTVRKPKERYKPKGKGDRRSLSDHECCHSRSFNENSFNPYTPKRDRLCTRCLAKRRLCLTASPATNQGSKRKAVPFQQRNGTPLPTCETCKSHSKKQLRKVSSPDVDGFHCGHDTEGESSENSSYQAGMKWGSANKPRKASDPKRPLASKQNVMTCPPAVYPKAREKNAVYNEPYHQSVAWERLHHCPHGNTIQDRDENCAVLVSLQEKRRNTDQIYLMHNWQAERSWKAAMPNLDVDGFKSEARSQHFNKHKKSQPQSQGTLCRKDTRC
ncbi:uncharacterized protein buc2l [Antennarius striatus]|uniref:uncharacterized protein buc2l n=1 Tax=Antennarius striatus TaxID=241820 RepID=UPI0035AF122B